MIDIKGFLVAIIPIALSPGASFTLAISNISIAGLRSAFNVIWGTGLGIIIHGLLVGLGISAFIVKSPLTMSVLQIIGILFLGWLGVKLILSGISSFRKVTVQSGTLAGFREALLLNLLNAKAIILYLTVVPNFAGTEFINYVVLSSLHVALMAAWIITIGLFIKIAKKAVRLNVLSGVINSIGGVFLIIVTCNTAIGLYN
ncbi:LysE family translocator [Gynuella sp.]|uniref:LysE family translocator n=1 Tax=Gynuella sp. TaxID=2969146 RepID=UPI003D1273DF